MISHLNPLQDELLDIAFLGLVWTEQAFKYLVDTLCKPVSNGLHNVYDGLKTPTNTIRYFK